MDAARPPDDAPQHAELTSRRAWPRQELEDLVEIRAEGQAYMGQAIDVSRGGVQIVIVDPTFAIPGADALETVSRRFPGQTSICFVERSIRRRVELVRVALREDGLLVLGCAFESPLAAGEAEVLGAVGEPGDDVDTPPEAEG